MAKTAKKNNLSKGKIPKKTNPIPKKTTSIKGSKKILFLLVILGLFVAADLISVIYNKSNESKEITVQKVQEFTGDNQPYGSFKAWDILAFQRGIALSDQAQKRILILDRQGKLVDQIDKNQAGDPEFKEISCLTSDPQGNLYVMDTWNALIRGFNIKDEPIVKIDLNGKGFYGPRGVAWDNNAFVIADTGSHRMAKVSMEGSVVGAWGTRGSGKVMFNNPYEIATDSLGLYYVVDRDNNRIQVLDSQGKFVREIRIGAQPTAEAIDPERKFLYVSSLDGQFLKVFSLEGKLIGNVLESGQKSNPMGDINGLSVFPDGTIATLRNGNHVILYQTVPNPPKT